MWKAEIDGYKMKEEKDYVKNISLSLSLGIASLGRTTMPNGFGDEAPRVLKLGPKRKCLSDLQTAVSSEKGASGIHCRRGGWVPQMAWTGFQTENEENAGSHSWPGRS